MKSGFIPEASSPLAGQVSSLPAPTLSYLRYLAKQNDEIIRLLRELACPPEIIEARELARQTAAGNKDALREHNRRWKQRRRV